MTPLYTGEILFDEPATLIVDNQTQIASAIDKMADDYLSIDAQSLCEIKKRINIPYLELTLVDADTEDEVDESTELFHIGVTLALDYPYSVMVH